MSNHTGLKKYDHFRSTLNRLNKIDLLPPYKRHYGLISLNHVDLSDNTNHFVNEHAHYPDVRYSKLKNVILSHVIPSIHGGGQCDLNDQNILPTSGVVSAVDMIIKSFCNSESLVVSFYPSFPVYSYFTNLYGIKHYQCKLSGDHFDRININEITKLNPTLVFICDPNNPIGSSIHDEDIDKLLLKCPDTLFVLDETYQEYSSKVTNAIKLKHRDNLVILRNFSKGWGLAELRIGAILSNLEIISALTRCIVPFSISGISEKEFVYVIQNKLEQIKLSWHETKQEKNFLLMKLKELSFINKIYSSDTNFICFTIKNGGALENKFKNSNLRIETLHAEFANTYRVTIGTKLENDYFYRITQHLF